ncbi:MAG: 3-methyl-2-oxobutanoate hydroxymethyltransferase [Planctomycetota bacterium]
MSSSPSIERQGVAARVSASPRKPTTLRTLSKMARLGEPFACLACYDFTTARWLERAGVHLLLMGDSAAEVVLGHDRTIRMPLEVSIALTAALKRGAPHCVVMADMVFMSYQADRAEALRNAGRYLTEGLADIVKVEVTASDVDLVQSMVRAGVPVCAHIGSLPQHAAMTSGYTSAGRTADTASQIVRDAEALEAAGASMLLIEATPPEVTRAVLDRTSLPVIGIGAGVETHGQILVVNDLLGLTDRPPRFADPVGEAGVAIQRAGEAWVRRVAARQIGGKGYAMTEGEAASFDIQLEQTGESDD